jgi:hypothetical protein
MKSRSWFRIAAGGFLLLAAQGCSTSGDGAVDSATQWRAPRFAGLAGKRVAILSCDEVAASRLPAALALRPTPAPPGETQADAEARRRADFRRIAELFATDEASTWLDGRAARAELYHHAFAKALLERNVELVERERIARVFGELRLNGEDEPRLTTEQLRERGVDVKPADYVLVANPIVDRVDDASALEGNVRRVIALAARLIEIETGEIVWIGTAWDGRESAGGLEPLLAGEGGFAEFELLDSVVAQLIGGLAPAAPTPPSATSAKERS